VTYTLYFRNEAKFISFQCLYRCHYIS